MRNLVIIIEAILFLIFIGYTGLGVLIATEIKDNIPLQRGVFTFFGSVILLTFVVAFFTIKKTIKLFEGNTLGVREFVKQKIKQDNKFILLIWLIIGEIALTLFWLFFVSLFVYLSISFDTDNEFFGSQADMPGKIVFLWGAYFAFICGSYFSLTNFLMAFFKDFIFGYYTKIATVIAISQLVLVSSLLSIFLVLQ